MKTPHARSIVAVVAVLTLTSAVYRVGPKARASLPSKLDAELTRRLRNSGSPATVAVIAMMARGADLPNGFRRYVRDAKLDIINGYVLDVPIGALASFEVEPAIERVHFDRPAHHNDFLSSVAVGWNPVANTLGYTGAGVTVAVVDSGITSWHDDLTPATPSPHVYPYGNQRVLKFVDFVTRHDTQPRDDHGHGTHVSGIVAGNGYDGARYAGVAPEASIVALRVLDENGEGSISQSLAALNWVASNAHKYNIRVVNMSVGAGVSESYWNDPLTLAAKALVDRGITVVAAAGNLGRNERGELQWGGIMSPGNAPWVLTAGAFSTRGTLSPDDDGVADFSSAGPTPIDGAVKPDVVAPGVGIVSLSDPQGRLYQLNSQYRLKGTRDVGYEPYLSLTGTSQATAFVSGTVALMAQANPSLTPNFIKAIVEYTANFQEGVSPLRQGAGYLNAHGAVSLARSYASNADASAVGTSMDRSWSRHVIWGTELIGDGSLNPRATAWGGNIIWGTSGAGNIIWGTSTSTNIIWGTAFGHNIIWGTSVADNVLWPATAGGK